MNRSRPDPDSLAREAMNRVLESERQAEATIADVESRCKEQVERARGERRAILDRAQSRIVRLHTRAAQILEQRRGEIAAAARQSAARIGTDEAPERLEVALEQLVSQLIGPAPPPTDGP